jgi:hypothetical protein
MIDKYNQGFESTNVVGVSLRKAVAPPICLTKLKIRGKYRTEARIRAPLFKLGHDTVSSGGHRGVLENKNIT